MAALDRAYWFAVLVCVYTAVAGLESGGFSWPRLFLALLSPLALAAVFRFAQQREKRADPSVEVSALRALRVVASGTVVWLLSRLGHPQVATLELVATLALGTASVAAVYALARIPSAVGLLKAPKSGRSIDAAAFTAVIWGVAVVVAAGHLLSPQVRRLDPLTLDYAVTAASLGSLFVLIAAALRVRWVRRLELGVFDRASGALVFSATALVVAIPAAAMNIAAPDRLLPAALLLACSAVVLCIVIADASWVTIALRATMVLVALGVPVAMLTGSLARATPSQAGPIALGGCLAAVLVGLIARAAARPLGPEQSRWLEALANARVAALVPDPQEAIAATLRALKATASSPEAKPELWRLDPPSVLSVNVAGTLEEQDAEAPALLHQLGHREPEQTLRAEVLRALQVQRPEVRPLLAWFEVRKAFSATIVSDEEGPLGFLLLPAGGRSAVLTLEEARAARLLTERMSGLLAVTSALERARRRQLESQRLAEHWQHEYDRVAGVVQGEAQRHAEFAIALARPLTVSAYSPAVRLLLLELERSALSEQVLVLVTPVGVAAEAWAAHVHLSGASGKGPLLCLDAATDDPRDSARWSDPVRSPVALCDGGTLFIRDVELLNNEAQQQLVLKLTERWQRRAHNLLPPPRLILSVRRHPSVLLQEGAMPLLEPWLGRAVFDLPTLAERPEDLRALIFDTASRISHGPERVPRGVERRALQVLLDHAWPGNEVELRDVVDRAATFASGPLITLEDLRAVGFTGTGRGETGSPFASGFSRSPSAASRPLTESESLELALRDVPEYRPRSRSPRSRRRRGPA